MDSSGIRVNLFSLQRVVDKGYMPVFSEVEGKVFIKKKSTRGSLEKVATLSVNKGRLALDCRQVWPVEGIQRPWAYNCRCRFCIDGWELFRGSSEKDDEGGNGAWHRWSET